MHGPITFKLQKIKDEENLKTQKRVRGKTPYHEGSKIRYIRLLRNYGNGEINRCSNSKSYRQQI